MIQAAGAGSSSSNSYNHSVSRSTELLSCARTALKIAKSRQAKASEAQGQGATVGDKDQWCTNLNPADLELYNPQNYHDVYTEQEIAQDGLTLLQTMESQLAILEQLVRRRGHTNDPTEEIGITVQRLEHDAKELAAVIATLVPTSTAAITMQRRKHCEAVQQWFQQAAQQRAAKLKQILAVRGAVLQEQAQRRQRFQTTAAINSASSQQQRNYAAASALFSLPPPPPAKPKESEVNSAFTATASGISSVSSTPHHQPQQYQSALTSADTSVSSAPSPTATTKANGAPTAIATAATFSNYGAGQHAHRAPSVTASAAAYGAVSISAAGYGGTAGYGGSRANASFYAGQAHSATSGMRQRKVGGIGGSGTSATNDLFDSNNHNQQQQQLLQRQQERQTAQRRHEALQAEKSLVSLGNMYGKMATLIHQQSDVLENIEDDVEAAAGDVRAGHAEISTLYALKKGNRALILKVFGLLIFFIVFMRFYVRK